MLGFEQSMATLSLNNNKDIELEYIKFTQTEQANFAKIIEANFQQARKEFPALAQLYHSLNDQINLLQINLNAEKDLFTLLEKLIPIQGIVDQIIDKDTSEELTSIKLLNQNLLLLFCIAKYNYFLFHLKENDSFGIKQQVENVKDILDIFTHLDSVEPEIGTEKFIRRLMQQCLSKIITAASLVDSKWMSASEVEFHIKRKNEASKKHNGAFYAQIIYNPACYTITNIDAHSVYTLIEKMDRIREGLQPRTQFIIYADGIHHALVVDVSWNETDKQFGIICVESTNTRSQYDFLVAFMMTLKEYQFKTRELQNKFFSYDIIGILSGLQKDCSSCVSYALALSCELAKTSFAELKALKGIAQPAFQTVTGLTQLPDLAISWRSVTALGTKAVLMDQSFKKMKQNLSVLLPKKPKEIERLINVVKRDYHTYIDYRRESLRKQTYAKPDSDLSVKSICEKTNAKTPGHALRIRAFEGPAREFKFLLANLTDTDIIEVGTSSGKNALHFAYEGNKPKRVQALIAKELDSTAKDKQGKTPIQCKTRTLRC